LLAGVAAIASSKTCFFVPAYDRLATASPAFKVVNWYTGTHPDTPYPGNIIVAKPGVNRTRITMYTARVTVRDAEGRADKRWLEKNSDYHDVLRGEFGLNLSDQQIDQCVACMRAKGTGDAPHPFFA